MLEDKEKYVRVEKVYDYANSGITTYVRTPFFASIPSQPKSTIKDQVLVFGRLEKDIQHWIISNKRFKTYIPKNTKQYELVEIPKDVFEYLETILLD